MGRQVRGREVKSEHRLSHEEGLLGHEADIGSFSKGDVVVRQGAPCMLIDPAECLLLPGKAEGTVPIVNLQTGSAWFVRATERVHPAFHVKLSFETTRRSY